MSCSSPRTGCYLVRSVYSIPGVFVQVLVLGWEDWYSNRKEELRLGNGVSCLTCRKTPLAPQLCANASLSGTKTDLAGV